MEWFKHATTLWDDQDLARLVGDGGKEGLARYGLWWRTMEIVAAQLDSKDTRTSVRYPVARWARLLSLRGSVVFSMLSTLTVTRKVTVERDGENIIVTFNDLLRSRENRKNQSESASGNGGLAGDKADSTLSEIVHSERRSTAARTMDHDGRHTTQSCRPQREPQLALAFGSDGK